jgi:hypothetical protein
LPSHAQLVDDADRGVGRRRETVPHVVMVPSPGGATLVGTF